MRIYFYTDSFILFKSFSLCLKLFNQSKLSEERFVVVSLVFLHSSIRSTQFVKLLTNLLFTLLFNFPPPSSYQKNAVAVAHCKQGRGLLRVNGKPIELLEPQVLREKAFEPVLVVGQEAFADIDIRVRVKGGGSVAQIYAIRQSIAKALVAYNQKCKWKFLSMSCRYIFLLG